MEERKLPFTHQNFGFEISVKSTKPIITDKEIIPQYSVTLKSTDEGENYSVSATVREHKLSSTINKFRNKTSIEWVNAYDQKGSAPTKVDNLLTTLGFE